MNSEEDEFKRIEAEAKRRAARDEDDDTQVYAKPCIGKDPRCPCQDGDACHYKDCGGTKALPAAQPAQEPVAWEHHEYRPYGAPGEIRIHAILTSQYMMPDGSVAGDFQWLVDEYKKDKNTIKLIPLYATPPAAHTSADTKNTPPPEWEAINNIIAEYGLQAIDFVAEWKAAQRKPLTDKRILADETLRYYFGQNGGAGPVSKQGKRVVNAIEAAHGIKETKK